MVGFVFNPTTADEEEKEELKNQCFVAESNKANYPFDLSFLELEDFSIPFDDSFIDFDSMKDWIEEESAVKYTMDDLGENSVGIIEEKSDLVVGEKCIQMGGDGFCEKVIGQEECFVKDEALKEEHFGCVLQKSSDLGVVEKCTEMVSDGLDEKVKDEEESSLKNEAVNVGSLDCCGKEKGGSGDVVEMDNDGFREKIAVDEGSARARCGQFSEIGSTLKEEMEKVSLNGVSNNVVSVGINWSGVNDSVVNGERSDVKREEIVNGDSEIVKTNELAVVAMSVLENAEKRDGTVDINCDGATKKEIVRDKDESESGSEYESESSSSLSSSSESSSGEDEDEDEEEQEEESRVLKANIEKIREDGETKREVDMEEGEIMTSDAEEMIAWSEDEDEEDAGDGNKRPIRSKNELMVLPPVPPVSVTLLPHHQILPMGIVSSVIGAQVIVEGLEKHNPLSEGSILWITESKSPLGLVDEIFGPVKNPYYIVRFNSEREVPAGIQQGTLISFVPEFAKRVLNNDSLYKKGYDASGENDEELSEEVEFSDDEKEAEFRRMQKMKKRGTNDEKMENKKNDKKKSKNRFGHEKRNQAASKQVEALVDKLPAETKWHFVQPASASSSSGMGQVPASGPASGPPFPQLGQGPGPFATSSNMWSNGIPCQQALNGGLPPMQGLPWLQQNHPQQVYQASFPNGVPFQQINIGQTLPSNLVMSGALSSFGSGPAFAPWLPGLAQNVPIQPPFEMGMPGQHAQNVPNQSPFGLGIQGQHAPKFMNVGENAVPSDGSQAIFTTNSGNNDAFQNFRPGMRRNSGWKSHPRGRGRFGGGRDRHQ